MEGGLFIAVDVVAALAHTTLAIGLEGIGQDVEVVGFGAEVAEVVVADGFGLGYGFLELDAVETVITVAFDNQRFDLFPEENVFKGILDGRGASTGGAGHRDDGMLD